MVISEQTAVFAAFFETHIDDLKGHVLSAVISHQCRRKHVAKPELQLELHVRPRREMPADAGKPAREAGRLNFEAAGFLEVGAHGGDRLVQPHTGVATLADKF